MIVFRNNCSEKLKFVFLFILLVDFFCIGCEKKKCSQCADTQMYMVVKLSANSIVQPPTGQWRIVFSIKREILANCKNFSPQDTTFWEKKISEQQENVWVKLCVSQLLLDSSTKAESFLLRKIYSDDFIVRVNAVDSIVMHLEAGKSNTVLMEALVSVIDKGLLETKKTSMKNRDVQIVASQVSMELIPRICDLFVDRKVYKGVSALISALKRNPNQKGIALALGDLQAFDAKDILLQNFIGRKGYDFEEVTALGKLQAVEAIPYLGKALVIPDMKFDGFNVLSADTIVNALIAIAHPSAIPYIKSYEKSVYTVEDKSKAIAAITQLSSGSPQRTLKELYDDEDDPISKAAILKSAGKMKEVDISEMLYLIANTSNSAFLRKEAIAALGERCDISSQSRLGALLSNNFPSSLDFSMGWKNSPKDANSYFRHLIQDKLDICREVLLGNVDSN